MLSWQNQAGSKIVLTAFDEPLASATVKQSIFKIDKV